jgi:hypothetical protein
MNLSNDPMIRRRMMRMVEEVYDKCVIPPSKARSLELTIPERVAIDRCVVKYMETAKYVAESFARAIATLSEQSKG